MNPYVQKVCPVILRQQSEVSQILAFRHPLAGMQLIKGTLKPGELPDGDALRELAKESGIHQATVVAKIGELDFHDAEQHWNIFLCAPRIPFADEWTCFTADGDGLDFGFFWHPLDKEPDASWHPVYARALAMIRLWNGSRAHDGRARVRKYGVLLLRSSMLGKTASIREQKTRQADNREGQFDYSPEVNP